MSDQASHFTPDVEALRSLPVEQAVARLIDHASELHASDLYIGLDRNDTGIAMRHQGIVQPLCRVSRDEGIRWIGHVRAMAGMPFAQKQRSLRRPLDLHLASRARRSTCASTRFPRCGART